jgi:hypothetical protein
MKLSCRTRWLLALLAVFAANAGVARAQPVAKPSADQPRASPPGEQPGEQPAVTGDARDEAPTGDLRVLVFVGDRPASGVVVAIPGANSMTTDGFGAVVFTLPEGEVRLELAIPAHLLPALLPGAPPVAVTTDALRVVGYEEVEVLVTLDVDGSIRKLDVETAVSGAGERRRAAEFEQRLANAPKGVVRGRLFSGEDKVPVADAQVFARGAPVEAKSDANGAFELTLPEGVYDLVVIHPKFATTNLDNVEFDANRTADLRVHLEPAVAMLDALVITAPHIEGGVAALVAERRESASVDDVIGAEEMSRSGDSDAAGALRRVTGITVVGGQFVYVRGMGERYSSTLLNGQAIPSPEPERRVIPLDLFSTDVLESVVIQKTPSPDSPGEFGGGVVQLRTKRIPNELTVGASVSSGMVSTATFHDRLGYAGGGLDFLGIDDGTRELPAEIRTKSPLREGNRFEDGFTREELAALGRLLPNNYNLYEEAVPPDLGFGVAVGNRYELSGVPVGFLASSSYDSGFGYSELENKRFVSSDTAEGKLELNNNFLVRELTRQVSASGIVTAGAQPAKGHEISATTLVLRIADNEAAVVTGRSDDLGRDVRRSRLRFVERQLLTQQLVGSHELSSLGGGKLDWRYAFSRATRAEPDRREYFYADESVDPDDANPDFQLSARPNGNQRIWNDLSDRIHDLGLDYEQPFEAWRGLDAKAKAGGTLMQRSRDYDTIRLTLQAPASLSQEVRRQAPEDVWAPENLNAADGWFLEDTTQATDAYTAEQRIVAGYAIATLPLSDALELTGGLRVESSRQQVRTFAPFSADTVPLEAELDNTDVLPSATAKWQITDELVLRGGYGRTVSRPDFRELTESQFRDVVTATRFVGNPELERATIDNVDTRLEYYFSTDEIASLSLFYKSFSSPIEQIDLGGVDRAVSWDNAESAKNLGAELEVRRRLGYLGDAFDEVFTAVNVALISSQVALGEEASGVSTSKERALQGQSPYVVNLQLGYDDAGDSGITAVALYNVFGRRIRDVGRLGTPDIFEEPVHQIDLVYSQKLRGGWKLSAKAKNLLDLSIEFTQGDRVARRYRRGRELSVGLSWSY